MKDKHIVLKTKNLNIAYGTNKVVKDINLRIHKNKITAIMGPSGCGKTTLLRSFNRIHELSKNVKITGDILLHGKNILKMEPILVRKKIGMVFQKPNPFPTMSIYNNVIAGYKLNGIKKKKREFDHIVESNLKKVNLWSEVKSELYKRGGFLSGGQQQRLCIARALAINPEILLLDEPTSALDPISTMHIEELLIKLKESITIIIVTHNLAQAGRISNYTAFLYLGELVEFDHTAKMFTTPQDERTNKFLTGRFG